MGLCILHYRVMFCSLELFEKVNLLAPCEWHGEIFMLSLCLLMKVSFAPLAGGQAVCE